MKSTTLALATAMAAGTLAHAQEAVQWRVEDGGNGHWYEVVVAPQIIPWHDASGIAESEGGYLACISDANENAWVHAQTETVEGAWGMNGHPFWTFGPWIGGYRDSPGDPSWKWVNGEPWDYVAWHPSQPDSSNQTVISFGGGGPAAATWADTFPTEPVRSYVIEFSADCNGDGIVDYGQCRDGSLPDYNGNNIPDCCEHGVPCEVDRYPVQWRVEDGGNGHWYAFVQWETPQSWAASQNASMQWGGSLACITAAPELSFIESLNRALTDCQGAPVWLVGGYQDLGAPDYSEPGGGWRWVSGEPWDFAAWFPGRPDDFGAGGQHFLSLPEESYPALFDDVEPGNGTTQSCGGLIEWSADCNGDGIVDYGQILLGELGDSNANGVPDVCECDADINDDGTVNGADISVLLGYWGQSGKNVVGDITGDGVVNGADLAQLLGSWGPCQ